MVAKQRVKPNWHLPWTPEIEKWTAAQIRINLWRFDPSLDGFDEVMQDAKMLFWKLGKHYPIVQQASHFFSLYRTSLTRMFVNKTRVKSKSIDNTVNIEDLGEEPLLQGIPNYGYFNLLLEEMPEELKLVLSALTDGRVRRTLEKPSKAPRENHNMRLKRRLPNLSLDDPVGDLKRVLRYNS